MTEATLHLGVMWTRPQVSGHGGEIFRVLHFPCRVQQSDDMSRVGKHGRSGFFRGSQRRSSGHGGADARVGVGNTNAKRLIKTTMVLTAQAHVS